MTLSDAFKLDKEADAIEQAIVKNTRLCDRNEHIS